MLTGDERVFAHSQTHDSTGNHLEEVPKPSANGRRDSVALGWLSSKHSVRGTDGLVRDGSDAPLDDNP